MNMQRLITLRKNLVTVEAEHRPFNMATWIRFNNSRDGLSLPVTLTAPPDCGFAACAVGWYCLLNPQSGLILSKSHPGPGLYGPRKTTDPDADVDCWNQIAEHFGISENVAEFLFDSEHYGLDDTTPRDVIDRIDKLLADANFPLHDASA
jgi:hypothetical protein